MFAASNKKCHESTARKSTVFTEDFRNVITHATSIRRCFRTVSNRKTLIKTAVKRLQGLWVSLKLNRRCQVCWRHYLKFEKVL